MVKAQQELTQLEKDILVAQEKLQSVCDAINRDQGISEQKVIDISVLTKEEKELKKYIIDLQKEQIEEKAKLSTIKDINKAERVFGDGEKHNLQLKLDETTELIKIEEEKLENYRKETRKAIEQMDSDFNKLKNEKRVQIDLLIQQIDDTKKAMEEGRLELSQTTDYISALQIELDRLRGEQTKANQIIVDLFQKQMQLDDIEKTIGRKEVEVLEKNEIIDAYNSAIELLGSEKYTLETELEPLRKEKGEIVKAKLAISTRETELNSKEAYIKNKFEEAGLSY